MSFMSNHVIHVKSRQIMSSMSNHVIHVKSCVLEERVNHDIALSLAKS
jgi:hypothetical protein